MKNYIFILTVFLFIVSCKQKNKNYDSRNQDSVATDSIKYTTKSFFKTTSDCKKDTCDAYVAAKYPVFDNQNLNDFVLKLITPLPFKKDPFTSINIAADSFINEYIKFKKDYPDSPAGYQWDQTLTVSQQSNDIISFTHINYAYTGGAHGMQTTLFYNLNKSDYSEITLNDILTSNYNDELTKIGEEIFRKNEGLKPQDKLDAYFFENQKFLLNNNFLITPEGLLFVYNQYEIKAYVYGITELLIPYSSIKSLIADNGVLAKYK